MQVIILGSGSKGNSTLLITDTKKILIDVGFSYSRTKTILEKYNLTPSDIDFILLTHNHKDHITGLASLTKRENKSVYIPEKMVSAVNKLVSMEHIIPIPDDDFSVDDVHIKFLHTSHDAPSPVGFIIEDKTSLVYMTDTGYISKKNLKYMSNKNVYIIESNHDPEMLMDGPYPYILKQRILSDTGHLSNEMTGNYLKELILAHLSETNNLEDVAIKTVSEIIDGKVEVKAARQEEDISVLV